MSLAELSSLTGFPEQLLSKVFGAAQEACKKAYCPYSKFRVGAALLTSEGDLVAGCNVENASYGLSICAERSAIVKAVSQKQQNSIKLVAVYAPDGTGMAAPCGACRQFLIEFNPQMHVVSISADGKRFKHWTAEQLLPDYFGADCLGDSQKH